VSNNKDWWPNTKPEQLEMAKKWVQEFERAGRDWEIKPEIITEFIALTELAEKSLAEATNGNTRTSVSITKSNTVFELLEKLSRDIKKRYLYVPPLEESDIIALGLKLRDSKPTPSSFPAAQVTVETFLKGRHELGIKMIYVSGDPNDKANKGYRVYYKVLGEGEAEPLSPEDLTKSFFTKKKKDLIRFDFNDSRKFVYIAVQIENEGKKGPWGPMVKAVIP